MKQITHAGMILAAVAAAIIMAPTVGQHYYEILLLTTLFVLPGIGLCILAHSARCLLHNEKEVALRFALVLVVLVLEFFGPHLAKFDLYKPSKCGAAAGDIGAMNSALALYQVDVECKQFPATTLIQLYSDNAAGWSGPYMATITADPWDNAYVYTSDGTNYTIQSVHDSDYNKSETIRYVANVGAMESIP